MALPSEILTSVDQITLGYTAKAYQAVVSSHLTELRLMLVVYVAMFGIGVLQGTLSMTLKEASRHILKALIIFQLATNWGTFTTLFYNVFTNGPEKLTSALIGSQDPTQKLEEVFSTGVEAARQINNKAGTWDVAQMLLALLILIATVLMTGVALFLIVLSKLGLAVLLSLAPLFISLALWKGTQGIFQGWINYLINCAMIPVVTFAFLGLILALMEAPMASIKQSGENLTMVSIIPYLLTGSVAILLYSQVLRISASLGGGVTFSAMGAYQRYVTNPTSALSRLAGKKISGNAPKISRSSSGSRVATAGTPPMRSSPPVNKGGIK